MNHKWIIFAAVTVLLSGCAPVFKALSPEQKRDLYERVVEEAKDHRERASFFEQHGFLAKALKAYEKSLFFGDIAGIDTARVDRLRNQIKAEREAAYTRANRALKEEKAQVALTEFNHVLKVDPYYKDARQQYDLLVKKPDNVALLTEKTAQLNQLLSQKQPSKKERRQQYQIVKEILSLRHDHQQALAYLLKQHEQTLKEKNIGMVHLRQGREAFAQNNLETAEIELKKAQKFSATKRKATRGLVRLQKRKDAIYLTALAKNALVDQKMQKAEGYLKRALAAESRYQPAKNLLADLRKQRSEATAQVKLTQGRQLLSEGLYMKAFEKAESILQDDPKHVDALSLKAEVEQTIKDNTASLLKEGEVLFDQNRFDEAVERFETVLMVEPDNNICKTYLVRINKRRETIEMLSR
jgi:tetratricopeptide (TPR) repeat protein